MEQLVSATQKPVCYPLVHLNGTSKQQLIDGLCEAYAKLCDAYDALKQAAPNRRDYYPLPDNWWEAAQAQHRERLLAIDAIRDSLQAEIEAIDENKPHNWNEYTAAKAAAPELLPACKRGLDALMNETHGREDSPWIAGTKQMLRAAISVAEGGAA